MAKKKKMKRILKEFERRKKAKETLARIARKRSLPRISLPEHNDEFPIRKHNRSEKKYKDMTPEFLLDGFITGKFDKYPEVLYYVHAYKLSLKAEIQTKGSKAAIKYSRTKDKPKK